MKIVFFSDAHGNQYAVKSFMDNIKKISPDRIIFGGDIFGYYYGTNEIIDIFRKGNIECLLGNHDRMFLNLIEGKIAEKELIQKYGNSYREIAAKISEENIDFLASLESRKDIRMDGLSMVFVHGSISDPLNGRVYPDTVIENESDYNQYDYVFCGHTHHKMVRKVGKALLLNPGSIGQQRDGKGCSYLIFNTDNSNFEMITVDYNRQALVKEIKDNDFGEMQDRLIEVLFRGQ